MKLDLAYNEMALLRELVLKKKTEILKSWIPKNTSAEQIKRLEASLFKEPQYEDSDYNYPCITDGQICARLLRKFQELEDSCKKALGISSS